MYSLYDRVLGCLATAGMGDGIGAPTEVMSRQEILEKYGRITGFVDGSTNLVAWGNRTAEITDDTSQMYEMVKAVIRCGGELTAQEAGQALVRWSENYPRYFPRNAGPTTRNVIERLKAGEDPCAVGRTGGRYELGTSNGAIMRIAGAGLCSPGDLEGAIKTAVAMTECSHATQIAFSAACAIACGIAQAMTSRCDVHSVVKACVYGAKRGEEIGLQKARIAAGARVLPKILRAVELAYLADGPEEAEVLLNDELGTDSSAIAQTCALAIGLFVAADGDSAGSILGGANIGGDTDTIACISGMLAGARNGYSALPEAWRALFRQANPDLDLCGAAGEMVRLIEKKYHTDVF